jgi:hypothetical protein
VKHPRRRKHTANDAAQSHEEPRKRPPDLNHSHREGLEIVLEEHARKTARASAAVQSCGLFSDAVLVSPKRFCLTDGLGGRGHHLDKSQQHTNKHKQIQTKQMSV